MTSTHLFLGFYSLVIVFFFPSCYSNLGPPLLSITITPVLCYLPPRFQRPQSPSKYRKTRCVVAVVHCQSRCILSCLFVFTRYKIRTFQFSWQGGVNTIKAHFMQNSARISAGGTRFSRGFLWNLLTLEYLARVQDCGLSQLSTSSACFKACCWSSLSCPRQAFHMSPALW